MDPHNPGGRSMATTWYRVDAQAHEHAGAQEKGRHGYRIDGQCANQGRVVAPLARRTIEIVEVVEVVRPRGRIQPRTGADDRAV